MLARTRMDAQWLGSPNFTAGRDGHTMRFGSPLDPSYIVLHTTAGTIEDANARFQQPTQQASAHYGIGLSGRLVQWVREDDAAWHAGNWLMNLKSIGIEHEDGGDYNGPRSTQLYATSVALVRDICARYGIPITREWIRMHREVSDSLTTCPDALDVDRIVGEAAAQPLGQPALAPESEGVSPDAQGGAIPEPGDAATQLADAQRRVDELQRQVDGLTSVLNQLTRVLKG